MKDTQTPTQVTVPVIGEDSSLRTPKGWSWDLDLTNETPKCVLRLLDEPVIIDLTGNEDSQAVEPEVKRRRSDRLASLRLNVN